MDAYSEIVLPIHIVAAASWFGSALIFHGFVEPTAAAVGKSADRFFLRFLSGPFRIAISIFSVLAIGAGMVLYWHDSHGFAHGWLWSPAGLAYSAGAIAALGALGIALTVTGPNTLALGKLERTFIANGWNIAGPDAARLERARNRLKHGGRIGTCLLLLALVAMVLARAL